MILPATKAFEKLGKISEPLTVIESLIYYRASFIVAYLHDTIFSLRLSYWSCTGVYK